MSTRRSTLLLLVAILAAHFTTTTSRAVNISNTWFLPQEGFPVFYRYFHDRITWFEADAVCQFHHGNLVTVDSSKQYDATRAYLKELDVVTNVWIGLKKKGANDEFLWTDYKTLSQDGGYWQEQIPKSEAALCAAIDPAADFRWHSLNCGGPETASFICELPVPPWARKPNGCMLTALPSLTVTYLPEQAAIELTSDCGLDGTRRIACKGQADHNELMHRLSCENGNESTHDAEEYETSVLASSTTSGTPNYNSEGGTESHQPPTRHRRGTDDVSTLATETNSSSGYDVTASTTEIDTPEEINITTREFTAPVVISTGDGLTLTRNHEQHLYTTTDPSTKPETKGVSTEYFVTILPYNTSVTDKGEMQKMTVDKPHRDQSIQKTEITEDISSTLTIIPPTGLSTTAETSASGVLNEIKEITISFAEDNTTNNTEEIKIKEEILAETVSETTGTNTLSNSSSDNTNTSYIKPNGKEIPLVTNQKTGNDHQMTQNFKQEDHRRPFLPEFLQGLPRNVDNQTDETGTRSTSDWASPSNQQVEEEDFQATETEPEIPARPNRGRRLIRPQGHSFYPYFLNRVLG